MLAFTALVPLLVLDPYERVTSVLAAVIERRDAAALVAERRGAEAQELTAIEGELSAVVESLEAFSWEARRDELRERMQEIGAAWSVVERAERADLQAIATASAEAPEPGSESDSDNAPPRFNPAAQSPILNRPFDQAAPIPNAPDRNALDLPGAGLNSGEESVEASTSRRRAELVAALGQLGLDAPDVVAAVDAERSRLLARAAEATADEAAKEAIDAAASSMRQLVVEPLAAMREAHPALAARLPALADSAERTATTLEEWRARYYGDTTWYRTVDRKGETMMALRDSMEAGPSSMPGRAQSWAGEIREELETQQADAQRELARLAVEQEAAQQDAAEHQAQLETLADRLKAILPSWISGMVSPRELMALFAPAVLVLLAIVATRAWQVRQTFLALRRTALREEVAMNELADGSIWTLVRRARGATVATALVYLGGLALNWAFFAHGVALAEATTHARQSVDGAIPAALVESIVGRSTLPSLGVIGHLAFAGCAVLVVVLLALPAKPAVSVAP